MKNKTIIFSIFIMYIGIIAGCKSGSSTGSGGSSPPAPIGLATVLVIDDMTDIPVVNGAATNGKIYIHNYSNADVNNVSITLNNMANNSSGMVDSNGFTVINPEDCLMIKANSFCALDVTTPELTPGNANSAMINIAYTDSQGNSRSSAKIVNYRYHDTSIYNNVSFTTGSVTALGTQGSTRHVVGYIVGGGSPGTIYSDVRLLPSMSGVVSIANGFINGSEVAAGQSMAVEFEAHLNDSANLGVTVTPYADLVTNSAQVPNKKSVMSKSLKDLNDIIGTTMFVNLVPNITTPHLTFGNVPVINLGVESQVSIQVVNDGNADANGFSVQSNNESAISISNNCGSVIKSNSSCSIGYQVNSSTSGTANITYSLAGTGVGSDTLSWVNESTTPVIKISVSPANINLFVGESASLSFTVTNLGKADLANVSFNYTPGSLAELSTQTTGCSADISNPGSYIIPANGSCNVTAKITALTQTGNSIATMLVSGNANSQNYSFTSDQVIYQVANLPSLIINPATTVNLSVVADSTSVASQIYTVTNNSTQTVQIDSFSLQQISGSEHQPVVDNSTTGLINPCSQGGTLAINASCQLRLTYGPWGNTIRVNESGAMDLIIDYRSGSYSSSYMLPLTYTLIGNSNNEVTVSYAVNNITGNGSQLSPYQGSGARVANQSLTLTYLNPTGTILTNFNVDTNNLPLGLMVAPSSTCPYGANTGILPAEVENNSCTLVLMFNQDDLAMLYGPLQGNTLISYPPVSWIGAEGFYRQSIIPDQNNATGFYAEYKQATVIPTLQPNYTSAESVVLGFTVTNADDYSSLQLNVSGVNGLLEDAPLGSGGCLINSDFSASCNLLVANSMISYTMPNYLEPGNSVTIPLQLSFATGQYAYLTSSLMTIYYSAD